MTDPNKTLSNGVTQRLEARGVPPEKVDEKIKGAKKWWVFAVIALAAALAFLVVGFGVVVKIALETHSVPVALAIMLAVPPGLCVILAAFGASEADGEATHAFLAELRDTIPFLRKPAP